MIFNHDLFVAIFWLLSARLSVILLMFYLFQMLIWGFLTYVYY